MKDRNLIYLIVGAILIGLTIGVLSVKLQTKPIEPSTVVSPDLKVEETVIPTFPLLSGEKVKRIETDKIIVEGARGEMSVPKNPNVVKVYKRVSGELIAASFEDVKVGQNTTLKIIVPGKEAEMIIEEQ